MDITRNLSGTRALVVGAGLALALAMSAAPTTALAEGRVGTTDVTIRTEIDNIAFKTPTVIPFVAKADGTLQGPSENTTTIDNLSAYGIHVTNMKIGAKNSWSIVADARREPPRTPSILRSAPTRHSKTLMPRRRKQASTFPKSASFDMGYQGIANGTDRIKLKTSGNVARVTRDIFHVTGTGDQVASITWTVEPGAHTA